MIAGQFVRVNPSEMWACFGVAMASTVACMPTSQPEADIGLVCDASVQQLQGVEVRQIDNEFSRRRTYMAGERPFLMISDAEWDGQRDLLYVLDGEQRIVVAFNGAGAAVRVFGGPPANDGIEAGGFGELPRTFRRNVLAALEDGIVAVKDLHSVHFFDGEGDPLGRYELGNMGAYRSVTGVSANALIAALDGAVLMMESDWGIRSSLVLDEFMYQDRKIQKRQIGRMGNYLRLRNANAPDGLPNFGFPYRRFFKRYLDGAATAKLFAVPAQTAHGMCFIDPVGSIVRSYRVNAPVVEVDSLEREAILGDRASDLVHRLNVTQAEFYELAWPTVAPRYVDVTFSSDSLVWLQRLEHGGRLTVDVFHFERGYLGSIAPPGGEMPMTFRRGCAIVRHQPPDGYVLAEWCSESG